MNPFSFIIRRPITVVSVVVVLSSCGVVASKKAGYDIAPGIDMARIESLLDFSKLTGSAEHESEHESEAHHGHHTIVATSPKSMDVVLTQPYVCQIHSRRHIEVCALEDGYLGEILVTEGQSVKKGDPMFKLVPTLYQAKLDAEIAEAQLAELEYNNTKKLAEKNVVSQNEVKLLQAKLSKAKAKVDLARAEVNFANMTAPFDGIVDRLHKQIGSLVEEGTILTTLSDNSVMWVYFNVPEADYLEYMAGLADHKQDERIELVLANGDKFSQIGKIGAIEAKFNNENGNLPFRADFPNPDGLLRHGQTGNVLISRNLKDAVVIPQRATFENLDKQYVFVVGEDHVVHQREIVVAEELDDIYVLKKGVKVNEKIILEGMRELRDGEKVDYEFHQPEMVLAHLKNHAE